MLGGLGGILSSSLGKFSKFREPKMAFYSKIVYFSIHFWRFQGSFTEIIEVFPFLPVNYGLRGYLILFLKIRRSP